MTLEGVDRMIVYRPAAEGEALTTVYEKDHIEKTLPGLEVVYLTSCLVLMGDGTHVAMWVVEVRRCTLRGVTDPKMKFLTLMPRSDGTKVRRAKKQQIHAKKQQIPLGLVAVQAKKDSIVTVMKDFQAEGEWQAAMEGFVPGAAMFFVEATPELLKTNIPKHSLTPYFSVMAVEEWAAKARQLMSSPMTFGLWGRPRMRQRQGCGPAWWG